MSVPGDVLAGYAEQRTSLFQTDAARLDEMLDDTGTVRPPWQAVSAVLRGLGPDVLAERQRTVAQLLADDGVTYRGHGAGHDAPWRLDPVPLVLDGDEWTRLERGLAQRAELLDLVLADLYGPRTLLARGLLPAEVVFGHAGFVRDADGLRVPGPRQLVLAAADLGRTADGRWAVLADRTQAPSGMGYALANRRVVARAMPALYRSTQMFRVGPFFDALREALLATAPSGQESPRVVLLTAGAGSETAFDQSFVSSLLGFPLVEGADLVVADGRVWQRSIGRLVPVDVVLRRVDSWFCDPLELRPDSQLGAAGLVEAARLGSVSVVNGFGAGVLENPALFPFLPAIAQALLGSPLLLPSVRTLWCGDPASREFVLANLARLVLKPIARGVGRSSRFGWEQSAAQLASLRARIEARPGAWVGQEPLTLSTVPTVVAQGLEARAVVVRAFAVAAAGGYRVMTGGLARIAADPDSLLVANQHGSTSKDVWVLAGQQTAGAQPERPEHLAPEPVNAAISPRVAEDMFWLGRYAERVEDVARLLRVADNRWRDVGPAGDATLRDCVGVLFAALGSVASGDLVAATASSERADDPADVLEAVLGDDLRIGTLAHDVRRLRDLAQAVRDQLSIDTWVTLRGLDLRPDDPVGWSDADVSAVLTRLLDALLAFSGLAAESMVRDAGWAFMDAGRRIERALQLTALLAACFGRAHAGLVEELVVESVVRAAESAITHRRRYAAGGVETAVELLLQDEGNPRSLAYQLARLADDLDRVPGSADAVGELLRRVTTSVRTAEPVTLGEVVDGRRPRLSRLLGAARDDLHALAHALDALHFAQPGPVQALDATVLEPV